MYSSVVLLFRERQCSDLPAGVTGCCVPSGTLPGDATVSAPVCAPLGPPERAAARAV